MKTILINWDPFTAPGRVSLLKNLDSKLLSYAGSFPEITIGLGGVVDTVHKCYAMTDFVVTATDRAQSSAGSMVGYKEHLFNGPAATSMTLVPASASYGTVPAVVAADVMGYIGNLRTKLMKNPNWTDAIAKDLWLYGTEEIFDKDTYKAHYSVNAFPGYMHFHVATKYVKTHNIYVRKVGASVWEAPIRFDKSNYDVHRMPTTSPENLEVMLKGIINNEETPLLSVITTITYNATI